MQCGKMQQEARYQIITVRRKIPSVYCKQLISTLLYIVTVPLIWACLVALRSLDFEFALPLGGAAKIFGNCRSSNSTEHSPSLEKAESHLNMPPPKAKLPALSIRPSPAPKLKLPAHLPQTWKYGNRNLKPGLDPAGREQYRSRIITPKVEPLWSRGVQFFNFFICAGSTLLVCS
jgi:hypothetical protein